MFDVAGWRRRWHWLDVVMGIQDRFSAVGGGPLAASVGLSAFLSLFPLMLVAIAVVGFLSSGDDTFAVRLVENLGLEGRAAETVTDSIARAEGSRRAASVIGLGGLLWSGLGVVATLQAAVNSAWQTKGRGLLDKVVALAWLAGAGSLFLLTLAAGPLLIEVLPGPGIVAVEALSLVVITGVVVWAYDFLGNQPLPWRAHLVGAAIVAVAFEILKLVGSLLLARTVASSSALYGTIGVVFAVLAYLLLYARLFVYGAVINVYRWEAAKGTATAEIEVPRIDGEVPLSTNRGGAVDQSAGSPAD